ncbi:MAG: OadG family protein [Clostridium sp.]|nr:OadG family protein [Prevotella sp.]MCM1428701.1 OadG family protein [Clostridium sp.]MCM1475076.1 OadG family protein [Muribaculaceae bacterium]
MLIAGASAPATAQDVRQDPQDSVTTLAGGEEVVSGEWTDSKEVNTVEESPVAQKMTQAEKNANAKENDSWGGAITIIAMSIVLSALIVLSILFYIFGKISSSLIARKEKKNPGHANLSKEERKSLDSGGAVAAIAMALSEHFSAKHDEENTILTLRRMKKAYSPWNSKIYNMRHLPEMPTHQGEIPRMRP